MNSKEKYGTSIARLEEVISITTNRDIHRDDGQGNRCWQSDQRRITTRVDPMGTLSREEDVCMRVGGGVETGRREMRGMGGMMIGAGRDAPLNGVDTATTRTGETRGAMDPRRILSHHGSQ